MKDLVSEIWIEAGIKRFISNAFKTHMCLGVGLR